MIITSRNEENIRLSFQQWSTPMQRVSLEHDVISPDIRKVINTRLHKSAEFAKWVGVKWKGHDVLAVVEDTLMKKADGMYVFPFPSRTNDMSQLTAMKVQMGDMPA